MPGRRRQHSRFPCERGGWSLEAADTESGTPGPDARGVLGHNWSMPQREIPDTRAVNIQRALDHIESRLKMDIDVADLAAVAHYSKSQFQHVFRAICGVPVLRYVRERRLTDGPTPRFGSGRRFASTVRRAPAATQFPSSRRE